MEETTTPVAASLPEPTEAEVEAVLDSLGISPQSNLIDLLQQVQERLGYLPPAALWGISRRTRIPISRVHGVVTFYAQFCTEPRGKHIIRVCHGTACHVAGAERVSEVVSQELGVGEGETTRDGLFTIEYVACLGCCSLAPVMMVDGTSYGRLDRRAIRRVLASYHEEAEA